MLCINLNRLELLVYSKLIIPFQSISSIFTSQCCCFPPHHFVLSLSLSFCISLSLHLLLYLLAGFSTCITPHIPFIRCNFISHHATVLKYIDLHKCIYNIFRIRANISLRPDNFYRSSDGVYVCHSVLYILTHSPTERAFVCVCVCFHFFSCSPPWC